MKIRKALSALLAVCVLAGTCITSAAVSADSIRSYDYVPQVPNLVFGDVNLDESVDVTDAVMVARYYVMDRELIITDQGKLQADVNLDGNLDDIDLLEILEYIAHKRTVLGQKDDKQVQYKAKNLTDGVAAQTAESRTADDAFIDSQMKLAVNLLKGAAADPQSTEKNLLISPLSVSQALAMTANGANGDTKAEMEKLLGDTLDMDALNQYYSAYTTKLTSAEDASLHIANSLWVKDDANAIQVPEGFLQTAKNYYKADAFSAPFDQTTVEDVNNWVDYNTHGMIPKLVDQLDPIWIMLLINALAFEAEWDNPYNMYQVGNGTFHAYDGDMTVEMMHNDEYTYLEDSLSTGFMKYYKNDEYSFAAILPNSGTTVQDYISQMTPESLRNLLHDKQREKVVATIPKFKYDFNITMNDMLKKLGMQQAFEDNADFSGLNVKGDTLIDMVLHKTFIQVDERGTKAGAVTMIAAAPTAVMEEPKHVSLNRPFIYMIVDNHTDLPVFIGYVLHPTEAETEE